MLLSLEPDFYLRLWFPFAYCLLMILKSMHEFAIRLYLGIVLRLKGVKRFVVRLGLVLLAVRMHLLLSTEALAFRCGQLRPYLCFSSSMQRSCLEGIWDLESMRAS